MSAIIARIRSRGGPFQTRIATARTMPTARRVPRTAGPVSVATALRGTSNRSLVSCQRFQPVRPSMMLMPPSTTVTTSMTAAMLAAESEPIGPRAKK